MWRLSLKTWGISAFLVVWFVLTTWWSSSFFLALVPALVKGGIGWLSGICGVGGRAKISGETKASTRVSALLEKTNSIHLPHQMLTLYQ